VEFEREELAQIYVERGVEHELAVKVADQLMVKDALGTRARDELGISEISTARPVQAALISAATFAVGASMPLLMVLISPSDKLEPIVSVASLGFLALLGGCRCQSRRCRCRQGDDARHVLGSAGDGL
jgi:VIT1/CCC1 family predicted Fe2+/Mn2+ transporter